MITTSNASKNFGISGQAEHAMVTAPLDAAALWRELKGREARIESLHVTEHFLVARLSHAVRKSTVSFQAWRVLECVLMGESQKCISLRLDVATSTVSLHARTALAALGVECEPNRAPLFLFMLFHAANGSIRFGDAHVVVLDEDGRRQRFVCFPRPDRMLADFLTPAEVEVARLRLMGATSAHIARERRTATRTIANQLANTYRKLRVSGRTELICKLLANLRDAPCPPTLHLALHLNSPPSSRSPRAEVGLRRD